MPMIQIPQPDGSVILKEFIPEDYAYITPAVRRAFNEWVAQRNRSIQIYNETVEGSARYNGPMFRNGTQPLPFLTPIR